MKVAGALLLVIAVSAAVISTQTACQSASAVAAPSQAITWVRLAGTDIVLFRDPDTNCDYLVYDGYKSGGITPRLGRDGRPFCGGQR